MIGKAHKKNLIYLTGFMGSGKSTLAPILANTLGYSHRDIDAEIERLTGKRITTIFADQGEEFFRDVERKILLEVSATEHGCVISLGGGTIANDTNLRIIKSSGILVYLKADAEQIFRRMRFKTDRPLLKSADGTPLSEDEMRTRINLLLVQREPYYQHADVTIMTDARNVGNTIDEIVRSIGQLVD
jgi:shikimate kinase